MHPFLQHDRRPRAAASSRHAPAPSGTLGLALLCLAIASGCGETSNKADVYEETVPTAGLDVDRAFTYRITLFDYSQRVGGFIEFYAIDGQRNTWINPYFEPTACDYFGAGRVQNDEFPIEVGTTGVPFLATMTRVDRGSNLLGRISSDGGTWPDLPDTGAVLTVERIGTRPARECPNVPSLSEFSQGL